MKSSDKSSDLIGQAERAFREAFYRLKSDRTQILPPGAIVSQNNVAREAGTDPSALRKSRYPELINEIQNWVQESTQVAAVSQRKQNSIKRKKNRSLKEKITDLKLQRDFATSLLVEADAKILELSLENERLRAVVNSVGSDRVRKIFIGSQDT